MIVVEPGAFLGGHGEKLHGKHIGESVEFKESSSPRGEADAPEATIKATLTALKHKQLPNLDDEFAKDTRDVPTLVELRTTIRQELETQAQINRDGVVKAAIFEQLVAKNPVDAPPALVDQAANRMAYDFIDRFERRGLRMPTGGDLMERLKAGSLTQAATDVKTFFLLDAVATAEKIEVDATDVEAKFKEMADDEGEPVGKVMTRYRTPQSMAGLRELIRNEKAYEVVKREAQIVEKEPVAAAHAETAAAPAAT